MMVAKADRCNALPLIAPYGFLRADHRAKQLLILLPVVCAAAHSVEIIAMETSATQRATLPLSHLAIRTAKGYM